MNNKQTPQKTEGHCLPPESGPLSHAQAARQESELEKAEIQIDSLTNELDSLLQFLSHDLRAPLRGIDGYSQALVEDYSEHLDPMGKAYLEYIRDSSRHLSDVIDGLLKLYRVSRVELSNSLVDLSDIACTVGREMELINPSRSITQRITPGISIYADYTLMHQLLSILFNNAFKFTSKHKTASLEFSFLEESGKRVYFLHDDGAGFDMSYKDKLFLPFQRLHGQHDFEGLGLGLAIAHKIIQRHNGQIWAESELERGTTIFFTI